MEAIAAHVARFGVEHHTRALQRPDASATEGEVAPLADQIAPASNELPGADHRPPTEAPPVSQLREKWVRQLSKLEIGTFARLLTKLENRAVDYRLVGALIVLYGQKAFPSLFWPESGYTSGERATRLPLSRAAMSPYNLSVDSDQEGKLFKTATLRSEDGEVARDRTAREYAQARGLEVLVACLPEPRDAIGPRHACALLAAARRLSAPLALQDELEERISAQLALVSADDLLLVSRPGGVGSETDVEWVLRMVAAFLEGAAWRARVARAGALAGARALEMSVERDSPEALERVKAIAPDVVEPFDDVSRRVLEGDVPTKAMSDIGGVKGVKVPVMLIESGAAESPLEQKPPAPRGKKDGARRPPWVWASLQTRRRPNMASLSPEKCESPPIADVTKPRGRAWRFGGRKAGGFDVETSTARRKGLIKSSEVENSGAASEQQPDWGALKGVPPRVTLTEGSLSGGISQPSTEPKSEKSAGDSSSVGEALAIPAQANGDDLSASSASDVAEITWYKKPAETYRGLQRYSRTTDDGESEEIYVQATAEELMGSTRTHPEGKAGFTALADFPTNEEVNNREEENVPVPRLGPLSLPEFSPPRDSTSLTSIQLPLARADPAAAAREILEGLEAAAAPSRSELVALGAILDEFLKTVAEDSELDVDAFCALATCLPGAARPEDDGLYVALVTFLTVRGTGSTLDKSSDRALFHGRTSTKHPSETANIEILNHLPAAFSR